VLRWGPSPLCTSYLKIGALVRTCQEISEDAIRKALAERLERERLRRGGSTRLADRLMEIGRHCAALPDIDTRSPDEIVGYDETGMWR
jgi:antitoxin VapB